MLLCWSCNAILMKNTWTCAVFFLFSFITWTCAFLSFFLLLPGLVLSVCLGLGVPHSLPVGLSSTSPFVIGWQVVNVIEVIVVVVVVVVVVVIVVVVVVVVIVVGIVVVIVIVAVVVIVVVVVVVI